MAEKTESNSCQPCEVANTSPHISDGPLWGLPALHGTGRREVDKWSSHLLSKLTLG